MVLNKKHSIVYYIKSKMKTDIWLVQCDSCGDIYTKTKGKTDKIICTKCRSKIYTSSHGMARHKAYNIYHSQKKRCENPNTKQYCDYGGRGIKLSDEFQNFLTWFNYVNTLDNAWKKSYSIDRIDNNSDYKRGNLRWATSSEQNNNRRPKRAKE